MPDKAKVNKMKRIKPRAQGFGASGLVVWGIWDPRRRAAGPKNDRRLHWPGIILRA